jgi:hypothetical protein
VLEQENKDKQEVGSYSTFKSGGMNEIELE